MEQVINTAWQNHIQIKEKYKLKKNESDGEFNSGLDGGKITEAFVAAKDFIIALGGLFCDLYRLGETDP
jgi:hypothetical protein